MAAPVEPIPLRREVSQTAIDSDRALRLSLITLLGRFGLGVAFLFWGLNKFIMGYGNYMGWIGGLFKATWLPSFAWMPFAYAMPVAEVALGAALMIGLFTRWTLVLSGLYMVGLIFGQVVLQKPEIVAYNLIYLILVTVALWASEADRFSLDAWLKRVRSG
jgi:thiosulfate dehydrogenase [quinone] large subunit